jgi:putative transposase
VPVRWSRALPFAPSSVTVIKDAAGRYFASFVVATEPGPLPETDPVLGIDLGLAHFAVLSDGRKICSPRFLRRAETKLRRAQRALSRKQKGSQNRDKARIKVARAHARVTDARREFHHQLSTTLIRDNQAVAVEDLAVRGLAGVQSPAVWAHIPPRRPIRAHQPGVLGLREQRWPQATARPRVDMPKLRGDSRPGRECSA